MKRPDSAMARIPARLSNTGADAAEAILPPAIAARAGAPGGRKREGSSESAGEEEAEVGSIAIARLGLGGFVLVGNKERGGVVNQSAIAIHRNPAAMPARKCEAHGHRLPAERDGTNKTVQQ